MDIWRITPKKRQLFEVARIFAYHVRGDIIHDKIAIGEGVLKIEIPAINHPFDAIIEVQMKDHLIGQVMNVEGCDRDAALEILRSRNICTAKAEITLEKLVRR